MDILQQLKEQLTSFEDACKLLGLDPERVIPDFALFPEEDRASMAAHARIVLFVKAANMIGNGGKPWKADYTDGKPKFEVWWAWDSGSSGFRYDGYVRWGSISGVGSRLCFISRLVMHYVVDTIGDTLYKEYL